MGNIYLNLIVSHCKSSSHALLHLQLKYDCLYFVIFFMFLVCGTWMILKRYDCDEYVRASSDLLFDLLGLFIFSINIIC